MTDDPSPDAARDVLQLQAIRDARAAGDLHAAREAMGQLLGPYWEWARLVAYAKLDQPEHTRISAANPSRNPRRRSTARPQTGAEVRAAMLGDIVGLLARTAGREWAELGANDPANSGTRVPAHARYTLWGMIPHQHDEAV